MEPKKSISFVDLYYWLKENYDLLINSKLYNIKQKNDIFDFVFLKNRKKYHLVISLPNFIFFDEKAFRTDKFPPSFCMQLRKYLKGKIVSDVIRYNNERIIEMIFDDYDLIIEFIPPGNIILTDKGRKIISVYKKHEWKDRKLLQGEVYKYPPRVFSIFNKSIFDLQKDFSRIEKEVVRFLAKDCGFSGQYAEELCLLAKIDKNRPVNQLTQNEIDRLIRYASSLLQMDIDARIYLENNEMISFSPFELKIFSDKKQIQMNSFNDAIKSYAKNFEKKVTETKIKKIEEKQKRIKQEQLNKLKEFIEKENKYRKIGELIYQNYSELSDLLSDLILLRKKKVKWDEIEKKLKERYKILKKIEYRKANLIVNIDGLDIEIDFRKKIDENASLYFEKAKKLKEKIESLKKIVNEPIKRILYSEKSVVKKAVFDNTQKHWYEKFRYFFSSNGFLVVSGKDAETNELLIRKYVGKYDLILHADIHGSPFTVIKNDKRVIPLPPETIYEAAQFTASYSRAWKLKLGSIHVYYFTPEQIVKQGGLPKGSFIIRGKKGWLEKIKLRLSIGIVVGDDYSSIKIIYGPPSVVKKNTPYLVTLLPGDKKGKELVEEIKRELYSKVPYEVKDLVEKIPDEKILELIPYGEGDLVR